MKSLLALLLFTHLVANTPVFAQAYSLTVSNQEFVFLENAELAVQASWASPEFEIPLGFEFEFFDLRSDRLYSSFNSFGGYTSLNQDEENLYMLIHFFANFIDRGSSQDSLMSPIYYKTTGMPGDRVFTLEYNHMGFFFGATAPNGVYLDYINIQVRLYEVSGDIEFHIGPYSVTEDPDELFDGFPGPLIGLMSNVQNYLGGTVGSVVTLIGDPSNPNLSQDPNGFLDWPVPENTVYRFSRNDLTQTEEPDKWREGVTIFPNPATDRLEINSKHDFDLVEIYSVDGKLVQRSRQEIINLGEYQNGLYFVKVFSDRFSVMHKLIIH